jgi:hypothetical protein
LNTKANDQVKDLFEYDTKSRANAKDKMKDALIGTVAFAFTGAAAAVNVMDAANQQFSSMSNNMEAGAFLAVFLGTMALNKVISDKQDSYHLGTEHVDLLREKYKSDILASRDEKGLWVVHQKKEDGTFGTEFMTNKEFNAFKRDLKFDNRSLVTIEADKNEDIHVKRTVRGKLQSKPNMPALAVYEVSEDKLSADNMVLTPVKEVFANKGKTMSKDEFDNSMTGQGFGEPLPMFK